jgi:hypothetical protein
VQLGVIRAQTDGKKMKKALFFILDWFLFFPVPFPSRPSTTFVQIILSSKRTGVSLKGSRWNWQETVPGEEKVNQLKFIVDYETIESEVYC